MSHDKLLPLLATCCITVIVTILFFFFLDIDLQTLPWAIVIVFFSSLTAHFFVFRIWIFNRVHRINGYIARLRGIQKVSKRSLASLCYMDENIRLFAQLKQKKIERLEQLETFRKEFVGDVSHELKTPIFSAQGFVHTLIDGAAEDKKLRDKFLKKAAKSLDDLNVLVQDLLMLSHIETGGIKMNYENIDLYPLCVEAMAQFESQKLKNSIKIFPPDLDKLLVVRADWLRITQVMVNLIFNAIKHNDKNVSISISFALDDHAVITSVTDDGEGIEPSHIDRIFERFYRVEKSRNKEKGGTGLGLAIVKHILEKHHTKIHVDTAPQKGSTFSFRLPIIASEDPLNLMEKD